MEAYVNRVGVPKETIGEKIKFLYIGKNLDNNKNDSVEKVLKNGANIIIFDQDNMICKN